jgi:hypothetical protein
MVSRRNRSGREARVGGDAAFRGSSRTEFDAMRGETSPAIPLHKLANARRARKWPIGVVSSACVVLAAPDVRARFRAKVA